MRASEIRPFSYLLAATGIAVVLLGADGALNLAMDPYSFARGQWYRLRAPEHDDVVDRAPDFGTTARANVIRRSGARTVLLGTSRTQVGFRTAPHAFNAGEADAAFPDIIRIAEAASERRQGSFAFIVELPGQVDPPPDRRMLSEGFPNLGERLFASTTTHLSLHLLGHALGFGGPTGRKEDFYLPIPPSRRRALVVPDRVSVPPPLSGSRDALQRRVDAIAALCAETGSSLIFFEPPMHPRLRSYLPLARSVEIRIAAYRRAVRQAQARYPACRLGLADLSQAAASGVAADEANWIDGLHFRPAVGEALLRKLLPLARP